MTENKSNIFRIIRDQRGAEIANLPTDPMYFGHRHAVTNPRGTWTCWQCGAAIHPHEPHHRLNYYLTPGDYRNTIPLRECFTCTSTAQTPKFTKILLTYWETDKVVTDTTPITLKEAYALLDAGKIRRTHPLEKALDGTWYELGEPSLIEFAGHRTRLIERAKRLQASVTHYEAQGVGMQREALIVKSLLKRLPVVESTYNRLRGQAQASWAERRAA